MSATVPMPRWYIGFFTCVYIKCIFNMPEVFSGLQYFAKKQEQTLENLMNFFKLKIGLDAAEEKPTRRRHQSQIQMCNNVILLVCNVSMIRSRA